MSADWRRRVLARREELTLALEWFRAVPAEELSEAIQNSVMRAVGATVNVMPTMTDEECWAEAERLSRVRA